MVRIVILMVLASLWPEPAMARQEPITGRETTFVVENGPWPEARRVWVSTPAGYEVESAARHDVFYVLDGRGLFPQAVAHARFLSLFEGAPEPIVVGLDSASPAARRRDFTPTRGADPSTASGGADAFIDSLTDLKARIDADYRTSGRDVLIGHSLAGLFTLHVLERAPGLFDGHIAISPTLSWDDAEILPRLQARLETPAADPPFVFISMADDSDAYRAGMDRLETMVRRVEAPWRLARFPDESHVSTVPPALFRALRLLHQAEADADRDPAPTTAASAPAEARR